MKTIKITEKAWKALKILKANLDEKTYSEAILCVIHTAIVEIYEDLKPGEKEPDVIKQLEKAIGWKRK